MITGFIITFNIIPANAATTFDSLKNKYQDNTVWNSTYQSGRAIECHGFALQLGYELTDTDPYTWIKYSGVSLSDYISSGKLKAGDIIRTFYDQHTIMVTDIIGTSLKYVDCNWPGGNVIHWDRNANISENNISLFDKYYPINYVLSCPTTISGNGNNPIGYVDSITSSTNAINIKGWAFDKDDLSKALDIHVYIGGPAGSGAEGHSIVANQYRPDVNNVYGVGDYHGFSSTIYTSMSGNQEIYVYAINTLGGDNVLLNSQTVYIDRDLYRPVIQQIYITDVTPYAFTVNAVISDDRGVTEVKFPTWKDGSPYVKWYIPECVGANTYSYRVHINDLTNEAGVYHTHVYAYDAGRNESFGSIDILVPDKGLLIYEIVNGNIHIQGANDKTVTEITIPSTIDNKTVTEISDNAFFEFTNLSKITLPDTVTKIGDNAFAECWHLKEFYCPANLTSIGNSAFSSCYGLKKVLFNDTLVSVGNKAFYTTQLNSVYLPKNLSSIGEYSFGYKYDDNLLPQKYDFTIYSYLNSSSELYAKNNNFEFIPSNLGDLNSDGKISVNDVTELQMYISQSKDFSDEQKSLADYNQDGVIDVLDVTDIQQFIANSN